MQGNLSKIGIIGAGLIGQSFGRLAVRHGLDVMLSNSRGPRSLAETASAVGCQVGTVAEAIGFSEVVLVAIPFGHIVDLSATLLAARIVLDANNYYPQRDGTITELDARATTTSEMLARHLPKSRVVKFFNAILARDIERDARTHGAADRRALPIAGDDATAKAIASALQDRLGYDVVDAGLLKEGWRFERARPAYCVPLGRAALLAALADEGPDVEEGSWRK